MPRSPSRGLRSDRERLLARAEREFGVATELDALHAHHAESWEHCRRVARACAELAHDLYGSAAERECLVLGGLVHDVGKLDVASRVLAKPGSLAARERALIEEHPVRGYEMLGRLDHHPARLAVLQHHRHAERAYPDAESVAAAVRDGWAESDVRLADEVAQVIAVVDMFDALTHRRSYKVPQHPQDVEETVRASYRGRHRYVDLVAERFSAGPHRDD